MAETIQDYINDFDAASNGADVKSTLIALLEALNTFGGGDAEKLGGNEQQYYLLKSEIASVKRDVDAILQFDQLPKARSQKVIKNKDLTNYFGAILNRLKKVNGDKNGDYLPSDMDLIGHDIKECLVVLDNTLDLIKEAINEVSTTPESHITELDSIEDYADKLNKIKKNNLLVVAKTITDNHTIIESDIVRDQYDNIVSGTAYNPVTVDVKLKGQDYVATTTGNQTPDDGYDGFSSVTVKVDDSGSGSGGGSGSGPGGSVSLTSFVATQNGEYGKPAGYDGYSDVTVSVTNPTVEDKPCTVTFVTDHIDGSTEELWSIEVQAGGTVEYQGPNPYYQNDGYEEEYYYFTGWEPRPVRVVSDITCKAQYSKVLRNNSHKVYLHKDIEYCDGDWYKIIHDPVHNSASGQIKRLTLQGSTRQYVRMYCVGNNTWISLEPVNVGTISEQDTEPYSWANSALRAHLNGAFLNNYIPSWLRPHLVPVRLTSKAILDGTMASFGKESSVLNYIRNYKGNVTITYKSDSGVPVVGTQYEATSDTIFIPGLYDLTIDPGSDFTDDMYKSSNFSAAGYSYNTYKYNGTITNNYYPKSLSGGLVADSGGSGTSGLPSYPFKQVSTGTLRGVYSPKVPKSTSLDNIILNYFPDNLQTQDCSVNNNATYFRTLQYYETTQQSWMNPYINEVFIGNEFNAGDMRLRDFLVDSCTLVGESLDYEDLWETDPETGEETRVGGEWTYNSDNRAINYTVSGCTISAKGYLNKRSPGSGGIYICFKIGGV